MDLIVRIEKITKDSGKKTYEKSKNRDPARLPIRKNYAGVG